MLTDNIQSGAAVVYALNVKYPCLGKRSCQHGGMMRQTDLDCFENA